MHKLAELCVRRPVFATMLVLSLTVVGGFSFIGLGVDLLPEHRRARPSPSRSSTRAPRPSRSKPRSPRKSKARSTPSAASTSCAPRRSRGSRRSCSRFVLEKDGDVAAQEVRDKVNLVIPDLPETALAPVIQKFDPGAMPVLADCRLQRPAAPRGHRDRRRADQAAAGEHQRRRPGPDRRRRPAARSRCASIPSGCAPTASPCRTSLRALRQQNVELPGGRIERARRNSPCARWARLADAEDVQ